MTGTLEQWIKDAESFEVVTSYKATGRFKYEFLDRYDDFYISLLNNFYDCLSCIDDTDYRAHANMLHKIAEGMLIYSEKASQGYFRGVNKECNSLYVATIYFLTGYDAVASYIIRKSGYSIEDYKHSAAAQAIYYVVSAGSARLASVEDVAKEVVSAIKHFLLSGEVAAITEQLDKVADKVGKFRFSDLDVFFDSFVLFHVLRKLKEHNLWKTLLQYDNSIDWRKYIEHSFKSRIISFLPSQEDAIAKGLLSFEKSFSLKMPTSAGKTYITELVIYQQLQRNPGSKILYLAPLRSLSRELKEHFNRVGKNLGFGMRAIYGGSSYTIDQSLIDDATLLISTPETFMSMEDALDEQLNRFSLVICDEGQLLDSFKRGISYELLITRLKRIPAIRYLFLSAIIPNIEEVNTWLGGNIDQVGNSNYRPCKIKLSTINVKKRGSSLVVKSDNYRSDYLTISGFLTKQEIGNLPYKKKNDASALTAVKSVNSGPVLLFTANKHGEHGCEELGASVLNVVRSNRLVNIRENSNNQNALDALKEYVSFQLGDSHELCSFIENGFGYHHGSLPQNIRELIECYYADGIIPLLICTTTLAEGVNLPVHTIVLSSMSRYDYKRGRNVTLDATELRNIVGRAGRAGRQKYGMVLLANPDENSTAYKNLIKALRNESMHSIRGTLYDIVSYVDERGWTDEKINEALEINALTDALDTMILKNMMTTDFEEINLEEVVSGSLAYHVGNEDIRQKLTKIFSLRQSVLTNNISKDSYPRYQKSGMGVKRFLHVEALLTLDELQKLTSLDIFSSEFIEQIITIVLGLPEYENASIYVNGEDNERELTILETKTLIECWISGLQYHQIASVLNCGVDNVLDLILYIQGTFHVAVSAIVRYVESAWEDSVDNMKLWVDMVKYGVNSDSKLMLIKCGLSDRIAVNALVDNHILDSFDFSNVISLRSTCQQESSRIIGAIDSLNIPAISKNNIKTQLNLQI